MSGTDWTSEQEAFWAGEFGRGYIERNADEALLASKTALLAGALKATSAIGSVVELGPNIGLNLVALRRLLPHASFAGVEINPEAATALRGLGWVAVREGSLLTERLDQACDLAFTMGVLIHINPDLLPQAYDALHAASRRYVMVAEYYNPSPMAIPYRGHADRLFKRDFAGEMLDRFADLRLVDYGFVWRRDPNFPVDDITWFLMEKVPS